MTMYKNIIPGVLLSLVWLACAESPQAAAPPAPETAPAISATVDSSPVYTTEIPRPTQAAAPAVPPTVVAKPKKTGAATPATPQAPVATPPTEPIPAPMPEVAPEAGLHDAWDQLLRRHVSANGKVNYAGFKSDKAALDAYLQALSDHPPAETWSRAEKMAYWINAYNAFTIDLIVDNYPISSILKLDNGKTWDVKRISLGGKKYSLNQIENEILRPQFKDARIHFAVNCAAKSCPPLFNRAYTASNLNSNLEQRTRQFINNSAFNSLAADQAEVSKIFEWYAADFGDLRAFLNKYAAAALDADATIRYKEYDWELNN